MSDRRLAGCLGVALMTAACASPARQSSPPAPGATTTTKAAGRSPAIRSSRSGRSKGSTTTAFVGAATTTAAATGRAGGGAPPPSAADDGSRRGAGAFAPTILRPQPAASVVVELLEQSGAGPSSSTVDHLVRVLRGTTGKPVRVSGPIDLPATDGQATDDEIRALADQYTGERQGGSQAVIHLVFLNGRYRADASVLGIADRGDVAAVFHDQVRAAATPLVRASTIEDAVVEHEDGHLLGLVDLVLHTGRQDPGHPGHSRDKASVMYYAIDSDLITQVLDGPPPVDFDDADRADLATIRTG